MCCGTLYKFPQTAEKGPKLVFDSTLTLSQLTHHLLAPLLTSPLKSKEKNSRSRELLMGLIEVHN